MVTGAKNFSFSGFIRLTRIGNLIILALAQYFTVLFLIAPESQLEYITDIKLFFLSLSTILIAAAGYIINDYYDVKIDYINKPERVIVGKVLKRRVVMASHTIINLIGIALGFIVSPWIALINFGSALLLWLYSNQLKRLPFVGNIVVAFLAGLSIYILEIYYDTNNIFIIAYALFAIGYTLIREVVKDIEDLKGDQTFGCKTIPVVYGIRKTKIMLYVFSIFFALKLSLMINWISSTMFVWLIIGNAIALAIISYMLFAADTKKQFHQLSTFTKVIMLIGILTMVWIY